MQDYRKGHIAAYQNIFNLIVNIVLVISGLHFKGPERWLLENNFQTPFQFRGMNHPMLSQYVRDTLYTVQSNHQLQQSVQPTVQHNQNMERSDRNSESWQVVGRGSSSQDN